MEKATRTAKKKRVIALAAERHLNKNIFPVMSVKGKEIGYPFIKTYKDRKMRCTAGKFGPKNMMMMDILGTATIHWFMNMGKDEPISFTSRIPTEKNAKIKYVSGAYVSHKILSYVIRYLREYRDGCIPSYLYEENSLPDSVDRTYGRIKIPRTFRISDSYLKDQLPFLRRYSSKELCELITSTGKCAFEMVYPIRYFDGKNYQNYLFNNINYPSTFYRLLEVRTLKTSKDGHVLSREYDIKFDTFLGYYFVQNCTSCYTDLIPDKFYSLSDYAQLLYRLMILPYYGKAKIPLSLEEIRYCLDLKTKDTYMVRKVVRRLLEELEAHHLISEPKEINPYGYYLYTFVRSTWKERVGTNETDSGTDLV